MRLKNHIQEKVNDLIAISKQHSPHDPLSYAKEKRDKWVNRANVMTFVGPVVLTLVGFFCRLPDPFTFKSFSLWINVIAVFVVIGVGFFLFRRQNIFQHLVEALEANASVQKRKIERLEAEKDELKKDKTLLVSIVKEMATSVKDGKTKLEDLATVVVASLYMDCVKKFNISSGIALNLYELKNANIRMLHFYQNKYIEDDNPLLLSETGFAVTDDRVHSYYCVKKILDDSEPFYYLSNWVEVVRAFHWKHWKPKQKKQILESKDRDECIAAGFHYNQYIALRIKRGAGIVGMLEIITYDDTFIAEENEIKKVCRKLYDTYAPLLNTIWDIAT